MDSDGYKLKHGRGFEVNKDLFTDEDLTGQKAYGKAGVAVLKGYQSEMPQSKSKKMMMYSSVGDDERRRANEIKEERDNLEYQKFEGNDVTATMENADGTLGATQALETLNQVTDTTPRAEAVAVKKGGKKYNRVAIDTTNNDELLNEYQEDDDRLAIAAQEVEMQTLRRKNID